MPWRKEKNTATIDPLLLATAYCRQNDEIMDTDCLAHVLTDQERQFFNTHGYLVIPNALDATTTSRLVKVVDRVDRRERTEQHGNHLLSVTDIVAEDESLIRLIDHPTTFPKIWGILGWNIYLYHSHLDVTPSDNVEAQSWSVAWHQDSMRVNDEIESDPRPRLSVKIGYYLTDVSEPNRGNTLIVPGSHLQNKLDCPEMTDSPILRVPSRSVWRPVQPSSWIDASGTHAAATRLASPARSSGTDTVIAGSAPKIK